MKGPASVRLLLLALGLGLSAPHLLPAAPLPANLEWVYPEKWDTTWPQDRVPVLDLRGLVEEAAVIESWIQRAAARSPRAYVLINQSSAAALRTAELAWPSGWLVLAPAQSGVVGALPIAVSAENDGRAVAALRTGTAPESLLHFTVEKERYDEAAVVRKHRGIAPSPTPPPAEGTPPATAETLTDTLMQRAVHLELAWLRRQQVSAAPTAGKAKS